MARYTEGVDERLEEKSTRVEMRVWWAIYDKRSSLTG